MKYKLVLLTFILISSWSFAQIENEANLPKKEVYVNPVVDVTSLYQTISTIAEVKSAEDKMQNKKNLFATGAYKSNSTYRQQSKAIKLPDIRNKNERIHLHITEKFELESYHDKGKILVSADEGNSWQVVSIRSGKSDKRTTLANLTSYAGKKIIIAFELNSDASNNYKGWTVLSAQVRKEVLAGTLKKASAESETMTTKAGIPGLSGTFVSLDERGFPMTISLICEIHEDGLPLTSLDSSHFSVTEKIDSLWTVDTTWVQDSMFVDYRNIINAPLDFKVKRPDVSAASKYADIVFFMDNSGSMGNEQTAVRNNVQSFLDSLEARGIKAQVGLCRFGQGANGGRPLIVYNGANTSWWSNYAGNPTYDIDAFKTMWANTNTVDGGFEPSYDALMKGLEASSYSFAASAQKIFILITDESMTNNNASGSIYTDSTVVINALVNNDVTVYSLSLSQQPHINDFGSIARATGGKFYDILSPFNDILDDIATQVSSRYEITYPATRPVFDGLKRDVEINVNYNSNSLALTGKSYTPGTAPKIELTQATLDTLHSYRPYLPNIDAPVQIYVYDYESPRPQDGGSSKYVKLYYRSIGGPINYVSINMNCDSIFGKGDTAIWSAAIPGVDVLSPGMEYYITASDSVTATPSPFLPIQYTWTFAVFPNFPPVLADSTQYPNPASATAIIKTGYNENDSITFRLWALDTTTKVVDAYMYYSPPDMATQFSQTKLKAIGNNLYTLDTTLQAGTTKFHFRVVDDYGVSSYLGTEFNPFIIRTKVVDPNYRHDIYFRGGRPPIFWNTNMQWVDNNLVAGDSIKIYVQDIYNQTCVATHPYDIVNFRVKGDDPNTIGIDGFALGDEFIFKIYKASTGKIYDAEVTYRVNCDTVFTNNGVSNIESIIVYGQSSILSEEDNWWSTFVQLSNTTFDAIFEDVTDVEMVKDHLGNTWIPGGTNNTLTQYVAGYGYELNLKAGSWPLDILTFGKQRDYSLESPLINVYPDYTYVGCPYDSPESLANISSANTETGSIDKLENDVYYTYYPQYPSYNTWLTDCNMHPGKAYRITSYSPTPFSFSFPAPTGPSTITKSGNRNLYYPQKLRSGDDCMHLLLPEESWSTPPKNRDMVKVYSRSGSLIGQNYIFNNGTSILIDGLDLIEGEMFEIRYENMETGEQSLVVVDAWEHGDAGYMPHKMAVAGTMHTNTLSVEDYPGSISSFALYPNPAQNKLSAIFTFAEEEEITFTLTTVGGAEVYSTDKLTFSSGIHTVNIPVSDLDKGIYYLTAKDGKDHSITKKVLITE